VGAEALARVLREWGSVPETPQDHAAATHAAKLDKAEGLVRWSEPAKTIYDKYRAFDPWPGVYTESMKLVELARADGSGAPGTILRVEHDGVVVACGEGALKLIAVQRAGKPRTAAADLARSGALPL
jgi:methionyl-tRNA formyltransferase